jgi:hypothetical protein
MYSMKYIYSIIHTHTRTHVHTHTRIRIYSSILRSGYMLVFFNIRSGHTVIFLELIYFCYVKGTGDAKSAD